MAAPASITEYSGTQAYAKDSLFFYAPNRAAPILFVLLFAALTAIHTFVCSRYHTWKQLGSLPWACLIFTAGFALRAASSFDRYTYNGGDGPNLGIFIASQVLLFSGPPVFELSNYLTLSRLFYYVPHQSPLPPGTLLSTFLLLDLATEILTVNGAIRLANTSSTADEVAVGSTLIKISLILQVCVFAALVPLAIYFHRRCLQNGYGAGAVSRVLYMQYASAFLLICRSIWRIVETFQGPLGYLVRSEILFYIFEGVFMLANAILWAVAGPGRVLPRENDLYLARDGVTQLHGPGWSSRRPKIKRWLDPFDLAGFRAGWKGHDKFWERDGVEANGRLVGSRDGGVPSVRETRYPVGMTQA